MPIAAVPEYLLKAGGERIFQDASPALRFGLLLPVWTKRQDQEEEVQQRAQAKSREGERIEALLKRKGMDETIGLLVREGGLPGLWDRNDFGARTAWAKVASLTQADKLRMQALSARQRALGEAVPSHRLLRIEAKAIAPFTTGLGNEHPLENGFAFLNPYGLPYLPGSGVKGVLRQAARELAGGQWGDDKGWSEEPRYEIRVSEDPDEPPLRLTMLDVLFGRETKPGEQEHFRGALCFWDVIPEIQGDSLLVEIMTPHYADYYQQGVPPHDSGEPKPISFLTVPPGSRFLFHVTCDTLHLERTAADLAKDGHWKQLIEAAFEHAFRWLGFGAKTAVGYGAMGRAEPQQATPQVAAPSKPQAAESTLWKGARLAYDPGQKTITAILGRERTAPLKGSDAEKLLASLGEQRADALKKKRSLEGVDVLVEKVGNLIKLVGLAWNG
jgi:CRISPR-associated protein Cmr6